MKRDSGSFSFLHRKASERDLSSEQSQITKKNPTLTEPDFFYRYTL